MNAIKHIRRDVLKVTQIETAGIAGVSQATVSRWEKGDLEPSLDDLRAVRSELLKKAIAWDDSIFFQLYNKAHAA